MAEAEEASQAKEDPRLNWMQQWVLATTKLKDDKWKKMLAVEEHECVGCHANPLPHSAHHLPLPPSNACALFVFSHDTFPLSTWL
jgi:hypothetical protein